MTFRLFSLLTLLLLPSPATAQNVCYPQEMMLERMAAEGKAPFYDGLEQGRFQIYVFVNPETRDWAMTRQWSHKGRHYLCFMESEEGRLQGQGWDHRKPPPAGKPL